MTHSPSARLLTYDQNFRGSRLEDHIHRELRGIIADLAYPPPLLASMLDELCHAARCWGITAELGAVLDSWESSVCARAHPHEEMPLSCLHRVEIARLHNENANLKAALRRFAAIKADDGDNFDKLDDREREIFDGAQRSAPEWEARGASGANQTPAAPDEGNRLPACAKNSEATPDDATAHDENKDAKATGANP